MSRAAPHRRFRCAPSLPGGSAARLAGLALTLLLTTPAGCDPAPGPSPDPSPPAPPPALTDVAWTPNPDPRVPLVATVRFTTDRPTRARALLDDGVDPRVIEPAGAAARDHELLLLGFHPDTDYRVTVEVEDADGRRTTSAPWAWTTPPLPDGFPTIEVTVSRPDLMEPGYTFIPAERWSGSGGPDRDFGAVIALDARGDVVWFFDAPYAVSEVQRARDGNLLLYHGTLGDALVMDMTGRVVEQWAGARFPRDFPEGAVPVDVPTLHHDVQELPSGHLLALTTETRDVELYPASEDDPTVPRSPSRVIGDVVVEFARDGTVQNRWPLLELLDPYRIGYDSLDTGFWQAVYESTPERPIRDWSHANSIFHDRRDDSLIVSSYHQDAVFKFRREDGELLWILGFPSGWGAAWQDRLLTPVGDGLYPFHQHAARLTPQGTLLMFDNGKYRALPFEPKNPPESCFSRAVEYAIDEQAMEFRQLWSYGGRPGEWFFTAFLGETDWLPETGHVLITDGGRVRRPDGTNGDHPLQGRKWARVLEVTHEEPARVVFEVLLDDPRTGWTVYRSERLPSLYPAPLAAGAAGPLAVAEAPPAARILPRRGGDGASPGAATEAIDGGSDGAGDSPVAPGRPRDVVLVLMDGVRADHVGTYGHDQPTTPRLDALAEQAVVYEHAWAASSSAGQSLSALWTGRLPSSGGAIGLTEAVPHPSLPTLPRRLADAGYRTALASNQLGLRARPFTRGFHEVSVDSVSGRWSAARVTEQALALADAAADDEPLLLVVGYDDATEPYLPAETFRRRMDVPVPDGLVAMDDLRMSAGRLAADAVSSPGVRDLIARYDAEIAAVDDALGALLDGLAARGRLRDALVVVTSSRGTEFLEHGYVGDGWTLHEETLHVPLVVWAPERLAPARVAPPVSLVDVLPSLAALCVDPAPLAHSDGQPLFDGGSGRWSPRTPRGTVLAELVIPELTIQRAVLREGHKLIETVVGAPPVVRRGLSRAYAHLVRETLDGRRQNPDPWGEPAQRRLFDLTADPGETTDVSAAEPGIHAGLTQVLERFARWCREQGLEPGVPVRQADELEVPAGAQLQQLGYL